MRNKFVLAVNLVLLIICIVELTIGSTSIQMATNMAILSSLLSIYNIIVLYNGRFSLSSAVIAYTIATQFGLILPYILVGDAVVDIYSPWTLAFLYDNNLAKAILLGSIAILSFEFARIVCAHRYVEAPEHIAQTNRKDEHLKYFSLFLLSVVLLFFVYHIVTGGMLIFGTYEMFMNSRAYNSPIYYYILILFYLGTLYLTIAGPVKQNLIGWFIWFFVVVIFAANGNKGEFLYALLASFGLKGMQGSRISTKMIIGVSLLLFVVIPTITSLRGVGIADNISSASFNPFGAFVEMGMQIRTSVYTLDGLDDGSISYLYGQSYWQPLYNILTPFSKHITATSGLKEMFMGFGYNQVIESFLNFGLLGVIAFYFIVGYYLCKHERLAESNDKLALTGSITTVLINATRNYFAFVPGQVLIVVTIYYLMIKKRTKNI